MGNFHHQAQIGRDHLLAGLFVAALNLARQLDLLLGGQQGHLTDLAQIESDVGVWGFHGF